jgi:hypothetical protein
MALVLEIQKRIDTGFQIAIHFSNQTAKFLTPEIQFTSFTVPIFHVDGINISTKFQQVS